jgi:hypothetical protein
MGGLPGESGKFVGFRSNPGQAEVTEMDFKAQADIDDGDSVHFTVADGNESTSEHYIWFDKSTSGSDPSESGTAHEVAIDGDSTEGDVASSVQTVIDAISNVSASANGGTVTVTNDYKGDVADADQGASGCCDSITITTQGKDFDVDNISFSKTDNRLECPYCGGQEFMVKDSYCIDSGDLPSSMNGYSAGGTDDMIIFLCQCGREFGKAKSNWSAMEGSN